MRFLLLLPLAIFRVTLYNIIITTATARMENTMSDMNEYTPELFELVDDEGNKKNFELIDAAELNGEQYFCMVPSVEDENFLEEDCDIVILKTIEEDGEEILASIDDDDEFERVSAFFLDRMQEAFESEDDE